MWVVRLPSTKWKGSGSLSLFFLLPRSVGRGSRNVSCVTCPVFFPLSPNTLGYFMTVKVVRFVGYKLFLFWVIKRSRQWWGKKTKKIKKRQLKMLQKAPSQGKQFHPISRRAEMLHARFSSFKRRKTRM